MERENIYYAAKKFVKPVARPFLVVLAAISPLLPSPLSETAFPDNSSQPAYHQWVNSNFLSQPIKTETPDIATPPAIEPFLLTGTRLSGKASNYSRNGCLGCSLGLIMTNGEPLDDNGLTIAADQAIPLNSSARITNLENGRSAIVRVTDRGGFRNLGRIADMTPATQNAIGAKSGETNVEIVVVEPNPAYSR